MQESEPVDTPRRAGNKGLLIFAVASALFLVALGYLVDSMLGWWAGPDWMLVVAGVVFASVVAFARLSTK
ncbi:hypothetical protein AB0436_29640 [Streptomyces sp. NPDC051322]|uniref:hypothetical protein n=1 Tax=Streptomyces sp. NPDC051322 TaxID=3154645 RepID=UPI003450A64D